MPPLYPSSTIFSRILVSIAALAHNCPAPKIFFHGKQEEISRFISRFDCLPCLLVLSSLRSLTRAVVRPQMNWAARTQDIDTNSIELNSKWKQKNGAEENTRNRSYSCAAREPWQSLGKYSIKIVEMETKISSELGTHISPSREVWLLSSLNRESVDRAFIDERMHRGAGKSSKSRVMLKCHPLVNRSSVDDKMCSSASFDVSRAAATPSAVWQGSLKV